MISTIFQEGMGLANELWVYAVTRAIAKKNGYQFGVLDSSKFKGQHFLELDFGDPAENVEFSFYYKEKQVLHPVYKKDISPMDEYMSHIPDKTIIDGTMQSVRYFEGIESEVKSWIKVKEDLSFGFDEETCVIHVRGGDFLYAGNTLLPSSYYSDAIGFMLQINPKMQFVIVTDHPEIARLLVPGTPIVGSSLTNENDPCQASHHIGKRIDIDFKIIRQSKYVILSNSSFGWWGAYLNPSAKVVAPAYWAAYNYDEPFWSTAEIRVPEWSYIDKNGNLL